MTIGAEAEIAALLSLSARVGRNPLLVQASSGNTSIKLDGTMWIKASGKWLAHARDEDTLVPVDLATLRVNLFASAELSGAGAWVGGNYLKASIETAMHAVLPHRVVIHVHSVNTISWAVRVDGRERLAERLDGLRWSWIPYVSSGLPLAGAIQHAIDEQPGTEVFVLANHGLVVCGESCDAAEELLEEVEQRVAVPSRYQPDEDRDLPARLHALGSDPVSCQILRGGILYPCQAIFLGTEVASTPDWGVVMIREITASQRSVLNGLLEVVQRLDAAAPIRYLTDSEVRTLLNEDAHQYQLCTENNAVPSQAEPVSVR